MREIFEQTILVADVPKIEDDGRQVSIPQSFIEVPMHYYMNKSQNWIKAAEYHDFII